MKRNIQYSIIIYIIIAIIIDVVTVVIISFNILIYILPVIYDFK
jgi:hypothetical protein